MEEDKANNRNILGSAMLILFLLMTISEKIIQVIMIFIL